MCIPGTTTIDSEEIPVSIDEGMGTFRQSLPTRDRPTGPQATQSGAYESSSTIQKHDNKQVNLNDWMRHFSLSLLGFHTIL